MPVAVVGAGGLESPAPAFSGMQQRPARQAASVPAVCVPIVKVTGGQTQAVRGCFACLAGSIVFAVPAALTLEYPVFLSRVVGYTVTLVLGLAMDFVSDRRVRSGVSFGDQPVQAVEIFANREAGTSLGRKWDCVTHENLRYLRSTHTLAVSGPRERRLTMVDLAVMPKVVSDRELPVSSFGPPGNFTVK